MLARLWGTQAGVVSTQVLQEFYVVATLRLPKPLSAARARSIVRHYATWPVHRISPSDILAASELERRHRQSFWDALVIVSAIGSGATTLVSEDMQHGRRLGALTIVDPFAGP